MPVAKWVTSLNPSREYVDGGQPLLNAATSATADLDVGAINCLMRLTAALLRDENARTATTPASTNTPSVRSALWCMLFSSRRLGTAAPLLVTRAYDDGQGNPAPIETGRKRVRAGFRAHTRRSNARRIGR